MSIGNVKTTGSKGSNWPWQYAMIKTLNSISSSLGASTEFESRLVRLIASPYTLYLEVRLWDVDSNTWDGTPKYYEVGSNTPVALNPADVQYADEDNALVLEAIKTACETTATETTSIDNHTAAIETSNAAIEASTSAIDTSNAAILAMNTDILAKNTEIEVDTSAIDTSTATTAANTTAIELDTRSLNDTTALPSISRSGTSGLVTIAASMKSVSFYNASSVDAHVLGIVLKAGETVNFDAGGNMNKFAASTFDYDPDPAGGNAGDLLVIYVA